MGERFVLQVYVGSLSRLYEALSIEASKATTAEEIVECIAEKLGLKDGCSCYELAEVMGNEGQECKERRISSSECPVALQLLWPKNSNKELASGTDFRFCLRRKLMQCMNWSLSWTDSNDSQLIRDYFLRFLYQPRDREYPDLCQLPDLTEQTLLENLKARFETGHIYTYVGSILIAVNPFKFYPIYNPKYVQLYQNRRLGELPPHIFAIADASYQAMLRKRCNQCIVISGESGSGKTESTNLLLHHLTALSQKGTHGSGVEQTILGAGPVLEAFGNAKTKHNNNSSRFGKFIQVNYKENGMVHGAIVQKYLLEKSRIVSQVKSERNYHVFYYLLVGASQADRESLYLNKACDYNYLNQSKCYTVDGVDESYEFARLKQSMEMVGFSPDKQFRCFQVLSAVLHLGNVQFSKKSTYHSDEAVVVKNCDELEIISKLLLVREETLMTALTCKKTKAAKGETLVINYKLPDAIATRDAIAKCLYGALFDWIVMQVNFALLSKRDVRDHKGNYIGVLDIFGFEDFGDQNNFEQFCINYANEHLQFYFNQHVFKYEQEEYKRESINWRNIDFLDNIDCLLLIEGKPHGLLYLLDDQCNFPGANNETVLQKFVNHHNSNTLFEIPPCRQSAFVIKHYAGKVKYQIRDFREKNLDLMRPDIVAVLKSSQMSFVRELVGADPLAIFRWQILKAFFRAYFIFSKLREMSKMKRGLSDSFIINEISANRRRTGGTADNNNSIKRLNCSTNDLIESSANTSRISKAILSKQALFGVPDIISSSNISSPQCVRGSLIKTSSSLCPLHGNQLSLCSNEARVLSRANKILMKSKSQTQKSLYRNRGGFEKSIKNLQTLKQLLGPSSTSSHAKHNSMTLSRTGPRKQTPTVTHQFQQSLQQLMETLNQANPFFVRCIKSNGDKIANHFDDVLVLLQLRYTGMLETVRIRQSGYSVRLSFDEFIQHYRILLPKGLLSSQTDVKQFLAQMSLNREKYQIGKSKIFMRESEKLLLDERLHQEILRRIVTLQRWVRTYLLRKRFNEMRNAAIIIQSHTRRWMVQQRLSQLKRIANYENWAATCIQKNWRSYQQYKWFQKMKKSVVTFQSHCRGFLVRAQMSALIEANEKNKKSKEQISPPLSSPVMITDAVFQSINSQNGKQSEIPSLILPTNEILAHKRFTHQHSKDSEESIGTHDDSDIENNLIQNNKNVQKMISPPLLPYRNSSAQKQSITQPNKQIIVGNDQSFVGDYDGDEDDKPRLDRRRNRVVRKLSLKKSKSIKSTVEAKSAEPRPNESLFDDLREHKQLIKHSSDSLAYTLTPKLKLQDTSPQLSINATNNQTKTITSSTVKYTLNEDHTNHQTVGALQKAKKTFKTFIGKSNDKSSNDDISSISKKSVKKEIIPPPHLLSYDSGPENVSLLCSSQKSSKLRQQQQSRPLLPTPQESSGSVVSSSNFTLLTRHTMKSVSMFHRGELCAVCENSMASNGPVMQSGLKCGECKLLFHSKCLHSSSQIPCRASLPSSMTSSSSSIIMMPSNNINNNLLNAPNPSRPPRLKHRKGGKNWQKLSTKENNSQTANTVAPQRSHSIHLSSTSGSTSANSSWMVTRTAEFVDPRDILITDCDELQIMDAFILRKICEMDEERRKSAKESMVDVVFKQALKEFKSNLISTYSVAAQDGHLRLSYKNLIDHFEQVILNVCQKENTWKSFPVIMGVNAFRGYMDELRHAKTLHLDVTKDANGKYNNLSDNKKSKRKRNKKLRNRRKKEEEIYETCGHEFVLSMANIPTVCEICSSLMWLMEKILVCRGCKLTCHKKCASKVTVSCRDNINASNKNSKKVFGTPLESLINDDSRIPLIVEQLITTIELKGLYTEGLYRKSGTTSKINELKMRLEEKKSDLDLDQYSIHVLTAALKSFFREMPDPLMTFDLYDDFLWSIAITDEQERVQAIYSHISKLPRANYDLLERLVFHLARVAQQESANRMNANSLAIVFAPCILRTNKVMQMQDKLSDISKQTICIECIISERMKQIRDTLADIDILDSACHTASSRLSSLRLSKLHLNREIAPHSSLRPPTNDEDEEEILTQQIEHLITEKNHLTTMLPSFRLASAVSDEDMLSLTTDLDHSSSTFGDSLDDFNFIHSPSKDKLTAVDFSALNKNHSSVKEEPLNHLTKNRVSVPTRRRPSRFEPPNKTAANINKNRRASDYVTQYLDNDKPVMV